MSMLYIGAGEPGLFPELLCYEKCLSIVSK